MPRSTLETTLEHLNCWASTRIIPPGLVDVHAPVSGVITDQQVTNAAGVQGSAGPNPFTISDISHVWIICDVYENSLPQVHIGDYADIHLNAYPDKVLKGRVSNIGAILDPDPAHRESSPGGRESGMMRIGMFVTATFHGQAIGNACRGARNRDSAPARPQLGLCALGNGSFGGMEVVAGDMLPGGMQEIVSGIKPGAQVVQNALVMQNTVEQ